MSHVQTKIRLKTALSTESEYSLRHAPEEVVSFSFMYVCTTSCKKNKRPTSTVTQSPSSKVEVRLVSTTCGLAGVTGSGVTDGALVTQGKHRLVKRIAFSFI